MVSPEKNHREEFVEPTVTADRSIQNGLKMTLTDSIHIKVGGPKIGPEFGILVVPLGRESPIT